MAAATTDYLPRTTSSPRFGRHSGEHDGGLSAFLLVRPRLFGIAYRILENTAEAEDVTQEVWLRWQFTDRTAVENPPAFLAMTTVRLCINIVQSARVRRESFISEFLPEQVDTISDPESGIERGESLKSAVRLLLEKLSPAERAAYILREAFDHPYRQIADLLQLEEANTRQLVTRARRHIAESRRTTATTVEHRRLLQAFVTAAQQGDVTSLEHFLADDISSRSSGDEWCKASVATIRNLVVRNATTGWHRACRYE